MEALLTDYGLDPRSFFAGVLWGTLVCVASMLVIMTFQAVRG